MSDELQDIQRIIADAIEDCRDANLDQQRLDEIRQLLLTNSEARQAYLKHNQFSQMLSAEAMPPVASDAAIAASHSPATVEFSSRSRAKRVVAFAGWGVAAVLVIALALQVGPEGAISEIVGRPIDEVTAERPMAVLTRAIDIEWQHPSRFQAALGQPITDRWLRVESGVAEVSFSSGATVSIEGPARLRLDSAMHVFSKSGKLTANCPPSAHGFTVRFRGGRVVDLGTEFGLDAEPEGKTRVHVLNGEVIVALTDEDDNV
jgi:ferric-dicitrate binding protein FerR (iron transport regulator)